MATRSSPEPSQAEIIHATYPTRQLSQPIVRFHNDSSFSIFAYCAEAAYHKVGTTTANEGYKTFEVHPKLQPDILFTYVLFPDILN